jgi:hypothetical protein
MTIPPEFLLAFAKISFVVFMTIYASVLIYLFFQFELRRDPAGRLHLSVHRRVLPKRRDRHVGMD